MDRHVVTEHNRRSFDRRIKKGDKPNDCWLWTGTRNKGGYGVLWFSDNRRWLAHRFSFFLANGREPELCVLHSCDNPGCVNPEHLREGTLIENNKERDAKGRTARGEGNGNRKLSQDEVLEIKRQLNAGRTQKAIAADFDIKQVTVSGIKTGFLWKWLNPNIE